MVFRVKNVMAIKVTVISTKEKFWIVGSGSAANSGYLGHGFKPPVYIHIPRWCVVDYLVQWDIEVDI